MPLLANALVRKTAGLMDMFKVDKAAEIEKAQAVLDDPNTPEHVRRTAQWYVDTHSKELEAEKLKSQAQAALDAANEKGGPVIMKAAAFDDKTDLIQTIPFVGGAAHGLARPARGSSRLESAALQGLGGASGGLVGGATGAGMGAAIMLALFNKASDDAKGTAAAIGGVAGGLGGAALGTGMGSALGRWMARRETMTPEDWKILAQQMSEGRQLPKTAEQQGDTPMGLLTEALIRKTARSGNLSRIGKGILESVRQGGNAGGVAAGVQTMPKPIAPLGMPGATQPSAVQESPESKKRKIYEMIRKKYPPKPGLGAPSLTPSTFPPARPRANERADLSKAASVKHEVVNDLVAALLTKQAAVAVGEQTDAAAGRKNLKVEQAETKAENMGLKAAKKKYPNVNFKGRVSPGARKAIVAQHKYDATKK